MRLCVARSQLVAGFLDFDSKKGRAIAYILLVIGRLVVGAGSGAATVVVPMYLGEVAPRRLRGMFGSLHQFMLVIAILVAQVRQYPRRSAVQCSAVQCSAVQCSAVECVE